MSFVKFLAKPVSEVSCGSCCRVANAFADFLHLYFLVISSSHPNHVCDFLSHRQALLP